MQEDRRAEEVLMGNKSLCARDLPVPYRAWIKLTIRTDLQDFFCKCLDTKSSNTLCHLRIILSVLSFLMLHGVSSSAG